MVDTPESQDYNVFVTQGLRKEDECVKNKLRQIRRGFDESQQALADAVGVSRQAIIKIEKQRVTPNGALMIAIANHYKLGVTDIFFANDVNHVEHKNMA